MGVGHCHKNKKTQQVPTQGERIVLHYIIWTYLINKHTNRTGDLLKSIASDFGSYDTLKMYLAKTSKDVDGNGWSILVYQPYTDKLTILQFENHEKLTQ